MAKKKVGRPRKIEINCPQDLIDLAQAYIDRDGFFTDVVSFTSKGTPNKTKRYVLVSEAGFMRYLQIHKRTLYDKRTTLVRENITTLQHVQEMFETHNLRGSSLGHINDRVFNLWVKNKMKWSENPDLTEIKREELELKKREVAIKEKFVDKETKIEAPNITVNL